MITYKVPVIVPQERKEGRGGYRFSREAKLK